MPRTSRNHRARHMGRIRGHLAIVVTACLLSGHWVREASAANESIDRLANPQRLVVEIIQMPGSTPLPDEISPEGRKISLASVFAPGGIAVEVVHVTPTPGNPGNDTSVEKFATFARDLRPPKKPGEWRVTILVLGASRLDELYVARLIDTQGAHDVGLVLGNALKNDPELMLGVTVGVVAQTLNLHHQDWEGRDYNKESTLEGSAVFHKNFAFWRLSAASILHLRHEPDEFVRPDGLPFGTITPEHAARHQKQPVENYTVKQPSRGPRPMPPTNVSVSVAPAATPSAAIAAFGPNILLMTQLGIEPKQITVRDSIEVSVSVQAVGADLATVSAHVSRAGTDQPLREIRAPDKERQSLSFKVPLEPGSNVITVSARDAESRNREQRLEIVREDVAPKLVAVVIGVQNYAHVDPLRFAAPDARSVKKTLLALGLKNDDAHLFYREDADLGTLRHALATWLPRNAGPNDIAIVYFAGHGAVSSDGMAEEGDTISKYLLPVGAVLNDLYSTALPMDELSRILSRQKAGTLIFLLDACFSGAAGSRTVRQAGRLTANLDAEFLSRMAQGGRLVFTASGANEAADERAELDGGHGVFTYYLLKALGGAADVNQDGTVDQVEMISWVSGEVRTLTARKQNPEMYGEIRHPIPLWRKPR